MNCELAAKTGTKLKKKSFDLLNNTFEASLKVKAQSAEILLFYQFQCPHCKTMNVSAKNYKKEVTLCSASGCRKVIIIENFDSIA